MAGSAIMPPLAAMDEPETALPPTGEEMQRVRLCLSIMGVLATGSMIGTAFSFYLVNHYPLLLVGLSPIGRHFILAAPVANAVALVSVIVLRRMLFYLTSYNLGRALGPRGIPWIEARAARFARFVRFIERLFGRAPHLIVLTMAGPTVSAIAGVSGMRVRLFAGLASVGLIVRMLGMLLFAEWLREYIEIALAWIDEYWVEGTVVMVIGVGLFQWSQRKRLTGTAE
jgi:membrane protein DedA with SNARE-associated domain